PSGVVADQKCHHVSKVYVSFRGGWGAAMLPGYPAGVAATSPPYATLRGAIPWGHPARNL
ncbi:MAG: hypothetical protein ACXWNS_05715, partial [Isosphaeraceae bacterium]